MRILHTSDWHLGRTLRKADLTPAFEQWCDYLVDLVKSEKIDAVLVSGDIYDRSIPPLVMVELLSETLERLLEHTQVVITSGNHDSGIRLGFASGLLRKGLYISTSSTKCHQPIPLLNANDDVGAIVYGIPYLDPEQERSKLTTSENPLPRSHAAVVGAALDNIAVNIAHGIYSRLPVPRLAMAHAFVVGGEASDSEQDLHIGGIDSIPSAIFRLENHSATEITPLSYVALGHLHRPQKVGTASDPAMRYSGSPIPFSFSEEKHKKSSLLLEFSEQTPQAPPQVTLLPNPIYRPLATLKDTSDALLSSKYDSYKEHFLRIYVEDSERPLNISATLRKHFPHALEIYHLVTTQERDAYQRTLRTKINPLQILEEFFLENGCTSISTKEKNFISTIWEEIQAEKSL